MSKKVTTFEMHVILAGVEVVLRETADNIAKARLGRHPYESFSGETPVQYQLNLAKAAVKLGRKSLKKHKDCNEFKDNAPSEDDEDNCVECGNRLNLEDGFCDNCDAPYDEEEEE
jgi:hypothetical protein